MIGLRKKTVDKEISLEDSLSMIQSLSDDNSVSFSYDYGHSFGYMAKECPSAVLSFLERKIETGEDYHTSVRCRVFEAKDNEKYVLVFQNGKFFVNIFGKKIFRGERFRAKVGYKQKRKTKGELRLERAPSRHSDKYKYGYESNYYV